MSRIIKFRAWDKNDKEMIYSDWGDLCNGERCSDFRVLYNLADFDNKPPIMQFTGLFDKWGREVYEGDILSECEVGEAIWEDTADMGGIVEKCPMGVVEYNAPCFNVNPICKGVVKFNKGGGSELNLSRYDGFFQWGSADFIVIGNVHSNPGLMKEAK